MDSDDVAAGLADWLLNIYREPLTRVSMLMVKVNALDAADRGAVSRLDIGDVVSVVWTPRGVGAPLEQTLVVEGLEHQIDTSGLHTMWLHTSLAQQVDVFTLDDASLGLLDTGGRLVF
jgi:hypothetical protein